MVRRLLLAFAVLAAVAASASPSDAVIACTTGTPAVLNVTTNAATYAFASFTPAVSSTLVVIAQIRTTVSTGAMVNTSGTALTWTKKISGTFNSGADTTYIFWANTPASTGASVYTIDVTGDNGAGIQAALFTCTGSDIVTGDPLKQADVASGASTNPVTDALTALGTNNGYVASWMGGLSSCPVSTPPSSGGGWTEANDGCFTSPTSNGSAAYRSTGETGTTITFTAANSTWGLGFAEIYVSGAGPGGWGGLLDSKRNRLIQ